MPDFKRKRNRLKNFDYSSNNAYFVTICARDKRCIFGDSETLAPNSLTIVINEAILNIEKVYTGITINKFVIMPNHVHMILLLKKADVDLSTVVRMFKRDVSAKAGRSVWQKSYFDHVIRNESDYLRIWEYIDSNPLHWTLDRYHPTASEQSPATCEQ